MERVGKGSRDARPAEGAALLKTMSPFNSISDLLCIPPGREEGREKREDGRGWWEEGRRNAKGGGEKRDCREGGGAPKEWEGRWLIEGGRGRGNTEVCGRPEVEG